MEVDKLNSLLSAILGETNGNLQILWNFYLQFLKDNIRQQVQETRRDFFNEYLTVSKTAWVNEQDAQLEDATNNNVSIISKSKQATDGDKTSI